ncbi:MAG: BglII/BstYI family type II restriction endonuclease [Sulfurimonas sp.]|uniref:BglII/BstYI family type II restriction endonuclease n=1 Tax=Sulfurimonas sp. TaxID=2022749 RepID=UPI0026272784|nr:BglII/BstYI family type II restriction endonuclease [Sulfurimonas sp.]MDD2651510.1 BglII/BstYI family type II restriction endonuclease [Sulfurimonas sp.]MDD3451051.1 BglII/BstYI family type II restriction endonuclease [Sulfurimonas sp.]
MNIKTFSYRYSQEVLEHPCCKEALKEITDICSKCPLPIYKNKSASQPKLDVVQQIINTYFKIAFENSNWESEPLVTPDNNDDSLRGDFRKSFKKKVSKDNRENITLQVEVEMGNIASSYRNYFKFQLSYSYKLADIAILILPCDNLSKRIDSGVASFEKTVREIPSADLSITVPILVIGLDDSNVEEIDISKITNDMEVVKGSKNNYKKRHVDLVKSII